MSLDDHKSQKQLQALQSAEPEKKIVLDSLMEHVIYQDTEMKVMWANRAACESVGMKPEDLVGRYCYEVWPQRKDPCPDCPVLLAMETDRPQEGEKGTLDGKVWFIRGYPVKNDKGVLTGSVEITLDITERKQAEEGLRQLNKRLELLVSERSAELLKSEAKYRELTENTLDIPCSVDRDGVILYVGPQVTRYGFAPTELTGRCFQDLVVPVDQDRVQTEFQRSLTEGETFPTEFRIQTPNGAIYWFEERSTIQRDPSGAVAGYTAVLRDITERKEAEEALRCSEEKFRTLAEQSPSMIFIYHSGRVVYVNPSCEKVTGYTPGDILAPEFDLVALQAPETAELMRTRFHDQMKGHELQPCELNLVTKHGVNVDVILYTRLIDYEESQAILGILVDITARKKAERLTLKQKARLRQLAAKLASAQDHEQRRIAEGLHDDVAQLLTACSVKLTVARGCKDPCEAGRIHEEVDRLLQESNEKVRLLSFELGSSTLYRLGLKEAINELCGGMTQRYGVLFSLHSREEREDLDDASALALFKSVRELLFNVVKHTSAQEVAVSMSSEGEMLKMVVEDNGGGFPVNFRDEELDTNNGLGLFAIRERLRDFGGKMRIDSNPNERTRVTLWMPLGRETGFD